MSKSTSYLILMAISACLLFYSPVVQAQNSSNEKQVNNLFNQAKNTTVDLVNQTPGALKSAYNQAKNTTVDLVNQTPGALKSAYNQAKNTTVDLVNQTPGALKSAYNQAKNTTVDLVNQTVTLIKNDTNSSKLLNQLKSDFGNLINEFSNFLSR
ncbi:MAG: hypothetical protein AB7P13_05680 [Candidatus Nitrosocosmicus sp.]